MFVTWPYEVISCSFLCFCFVVRDRLLHNLDPNSEYSSFTQRSISLTSTVFPDEPAVKHRPTHTRTHISQKSVSLLIAKTKQACFSKNILTRIDWF